MYEEDLKKGENYDKLKRTVCINLLSFNYLKNDRYHNGYRLKEMETNEELTDIQEIHFIELPKLKESDEVEVSNLLEAWVSFIKNPESKRVKALERNIDEIKKAKEELVNLSSDKEQRDIYLQRMMAISDRVSDLENATQKGIEEGERRAKEEVVRKLLGLNTPLETIITITGLSKEDITFLSKN